MLAILTQFQRATDGRTDERNCYTLILPCAFIKECWHVRAVDVCLQTLIRCHSVIRERELIVSTFGLS